MKKITTLCVMGLLCLSSFGVEYYVDIESRGGPANDNGPGTKEKPWRTLARAMCPIKPTVDAGDTIWMRGGTYRESWGAISNVGVTIKSYNNYYGKDTNENCGFRQLRR